MMSRMTTLTVAVGGLLSAAFGAPNALAQGAAKPAAAPRVRIVEPKAGATVTGPAVHVVLEVQGIEIAPAAEHKPGTAHHHLFLDTDLTPADQPIPMGAAGIWHGGKGQTEYTFENVAPGPHRLIAVLADPNHVPLNPLAVDTVRFTVK
jgi:hypothetical protein